MRFLLDEINMGNENIHVVEVVEKAIKHLFYSCFIVHCI